MRFSWSHETREGSHYCDVALYIEGGEPTLHCEAYQSGAWHIYKLGKTKKITIKKGRAKGISSARSAVERYLIQRLEEEEPIKSYSPIALKSSSTTARNIWRYWALRLLAFCLLSLFIWYGLGYAPLRTVCALVVLIVILVLRRRVLRIQRGELAVSQLFVLSSRGGS